MFSAGFFGLKYATLSYRVWAAERGVVLPITLFGDDGAFRPGEHPGRVHIVRWLSDTPFYRDALEIVSEKQRHFWWGQQANLGLTAWSMFVAIEGRRRKISNLWVFLALSQLINLSFAQNLFFIAVLLTPVPLPGNVKDITRDSMGVTSNRFSEIKEKMFPEKPEGFIPHTGLYISLILTNFMSIFLIPFASNTPSFTTISILSRTLPFSFLALPYIIPQSWGKIHTNPHTPQLTYSTIFRTISAISLLHLKTTTLALIHNTPSEYTYRHSILHPFSSEHHSTLDRGSTAVTSLLGAIGEHPAVSAAGWDVLLSGLNLGIWAAARGLDANDTMSSCIPFFGSVKKVSEAAEEVIVDEIKEELTSTSRTPGRPKKSATTGKRGRPAKNRLPTPEDTYQPDETGPVAEGDEEVEEDWESAALAWGGIAIGGLGFGSAGAYGGEVRAR
ncbi:hypothetical protein HYALB_00010625 [Hymenoscyphus albidus]|uniref:Uncharacterized protein n=1 Tax=Hymenoscyphus albidus TaxID=595503 RepID=A0A9N9LFP5_9HELO|nr:hypothetical protein HYALB_00010625 [Hymenoscyphus albidus]